MEEIRPIIRGESIIGIDYKSQTFPIKPISMDQLSGVVEKFKNFVSMLEPSYFDSKRNYQSNASLESTKSAKKEWEPEKLEAFIKNHLRDDQRAALTIIQEKGPLRQKELVKLLEKKTGRNYSGATGGYKLGGILMGITVKANTFGYESPFKRVWKSIQSELERHKYYEVSKEQYKPVIKNSIGTVGPAN